jgi:hypothetical protein
MVLAHRVIELGSVIAVELAELRVLVAKGMLFAILTPELIEGEIELLVGFELAVDVIKIRQRLAGAWTDTGGGNSFCSSASSVRSSGKGQKSPAFSARC